MKLRGRILLAFFGAIGVAMVATDLSYRLAYGYQNTHHITWSPWTNALVSLGIPFFWTVLFLVFAAWRLSRRISRPLQELAEAARRLKGRDLNFQITYDAPDEIGAVCHAFSEMQGALSASLDREWREQEARREMVAALAHDLRTPLTVVRGHAEALLAATPERRAERLERYLRAIGGAARRASSLLDDLLTLGRLEQADFRLQPRMVDLRAELAAWATEYELWAQEQAITFRWEPDPAAGGAGVTAAVDPLRLRQVLDNLLANSLRYTPVGGEITLSLRSTPGEVRVEVRDTGSGIAAADLPHLFERHFQGSSGEGGAAGLGLYICRLLVERHGGRIAAGSPPGGGSWVAFTLPRGDA